MTWDDSSQGAELYDGFISAAAEGDHGGRGLVLLARLAPPGDACVRCASSELTMMLPRSL